MSTTKQNIIVIGAGVTGLQTAVSLLQSGYRVTIIAKHLPGDYDAEYASPWAGAQWRTHASAEEEEQCAWDAETYEAWMRVVEGEEKEGKGGDCAGSSGSGLKLFTCLHYWYVHVSSERPALKINFASFPIAVVALLPNASTFPSIPTPSIAYPTALTYPLQSHPLQVNHTLRPYPPRETPTPEISCGASSLWWRHLVKEFTTIPRSALPSGVHFGVSFTTFAINVPQYLAYLLTKVQSLGGAVIRAVLPTEGGLPVALDAAATLVASRSGAKKETHDYAFINATGLAARELVGDEAMYPTRGQTVLVRGEASMLRKRIGDGKIAYCIVRPRSGTTILGGTKDVGEWNCEADDEVTKRILREGKALCAELLNGKGEFEVLGVGVGLRPSRKGGARLEREVLKCGDGRERLVVHNYGHGGAGYQNSVGAANKVVRLIGEADEFYGQGAEAKSRL